MPLRLDSRDPGFEAAFKDFLGAKRETGQDQTSSELGAKAATPEGDKT